MRIERFPTITQKESIFSKYVKKYLHLVLRQRFFELQLVDVVFF